MNVAPSLKLTIPSSSIVLNLNPPTKTFDSEDFTVEVGTNNQTGYTLTLSTPNDDTFLNRDSSSDGVSAKLYTLDSGTYTETTFTPDKWGYSINSNTAIPSTITSGFVPFQSGNTLMESSTAVNHDETELTFAAKIDYLQPAGSYATDLIFNLVANPLVDYMQDLDPTLCTTTPMTAVDNRDGQEYTIQKLADGNCWMMTNLNLGAVELTKDLTSKNTNLAATITASDFNGWKKTTNTANVNAGEFIPVNGTDSTSQTPYGTLYNYYAASAGTISGSSNTSDAIYDICPSGWRMPTGGANGEFQNLYNQSAYNTLAKMRAPISSGGAALAMNGCALNSGPEGVGNLYANYWASTYGNGGAGYMNALNVNINGGSNHIAPAATYVRGYGFGIRCVLKQTMQNFSSADATAMATNSIRFLSDSRDGQLYSVAKLGDGNVWMTRNLAIGCDGAGTNYGGNIVSKNLTPSDSNIISGWATPTDNLSLGDSNTDPRMACSSTYGAWYNYAAVTAGTINQATTTDEAEYSICPKGWRLPNYNEENAILSYQSIFQSTIGGCWYNSALRDTTYGGVMSSTAYNGTNRWRILNSSGSLSMYGAGNGRSMGMYARCIKD